MEVGSGEIGLEVEKRDGRGGGGISNERAGVGGAGGGH